MNLNNPHIFISSIGLIPALILLIFPNPNYIIKAISTALITISLGYVSGACHFYYLGDRQQVSL